MLASSVHAKPIFSFMPGPLGATPKALMGDLAQGSYMITNQSSMPIASNVSIQAPPGVQITSENCSTMNPFPAGATCTVTFNYVVTGEGCDFTSPCFQKAPSIDVIAYNGLICSKPEHKDLLITRVLDAAVTVSADAADKHLGLRAVNVTTGATLNRVPTTITISPSLTNKIQLCSATANTNTFYSTSPGVAPVENSAYCGENSAINNAESIAPSTTAKIWFRALDNPNCEGSTEGTITIQAGTVTKVIQVNYQRDLYAVGGQLQLPSLLTMPTGAVRLRNNVWEDIASNDSAALGQGLIKSIAVDNHGDIVLGGNLNSAGLTSLAKYNCVTNAWEPIVSGTAAVSYTHLTLPTIYSV